MRIAAALVGVILLVGVVAASSQLTFTEEVEATEWSAQFNTNMTESSVTESLSPGETISVEIEMQNPGIYLATWQATVSPSGGVITNPQWQVDLYAPTSVDITDHGNATEGSWQNEGSSTAMVNSTVPSSMNDTDADALTTRVEEWTQKEGWDWALGTWIVDLTYTDDGDPVFTASAECTITLTIEYYEPPRESEYTTNNTTEEQVRSFGLAVGGVLGLPILAGTPVLAWLAGRPPLV